MNDLFGSISGAGSYLNTGTEGKRYGVNLASVVSIEDPAGLGRVQCSFITAEDEVDNTEWAHVATPFAGKDYGLFFHPRVGDVVLLAFEEGDIHAPFVIGSLWWKNAKITNEAPVKIDANNKESDIYKIFTPNGHSITLDDTKDKEQIEVLSKAGHVIRIDDMNKKMELLSGDGNGITLDTEQGILSIKCKEFNVDAEGNTFSLSAQGAVIDTKAAVQVKGGSEVAVEASGNTTVKGAALNLEASGVANLKGAMVKIG